MTAIRARLGAWADATGAWLFDTNRYVTALVTILVAFPPLMASVALAKYLASTEQANAGGPSLVMGIWLGFLLSLIAGPLSWVFFIPQRANPYEYREILNRLRELAKDEKAQAALAELTKSARPAAGGESLVEVLFRDRGMRWAAGHGYLDVWTLIHQVEEGLFEVKDVDWLLAQANNDLLRVKGSPMPQADALTATIQASVKALSPTAMKVYVHSAPPDDPFVADKKKWPGLARLNLQAARAAINAYRQSLWDGLVRARNQFARTLIATSLLTAVVVDLIVLRNTDHQLVLVATVIYLVGVLVGLFARLQGLVNSRNVEEDFGLDTAHLLAAPILSGVAAVVGVILVSLLHLTVGDITIGSPSAAPQASILKATFNLGTNPGALVIAALFGLAPELLIRYLQSQADTFSKGLSATEPWGQSSAAKVPS